MLGLIRILNRSIRSIAIRVTIILLSQLFYSEGSSSSDVAGVFVKLMYVEFEFVKGSCS